MKTFIVTLVLLLASSQSMAGERSVKCQIDSGKETVYKGKCLFIPDSGGSFALANPIKDKSLTGEVIMVSVTIIEKSVAEVRGLTSAGINSRWGEAKRSAKDKACWVGEDFKICAW